MIRTHLYVDIYIYIYLSLSQRRTEVSNSLDERGALAPRWLL